MPWEHCGAALADTDACACGMTKDRWTVEFEVTRTFQVKRGPPALRLTVVDARERPLANEPFRVEADGAPAVEGTLDELGTAKVARAGACRVVFPRLRARDLAAWDADGAAPEVVADAPATFACAAGRALRLRRRPLHSARWVTPGGALRAHVHEAVRLQVGADLDDGLEVTLLVLEHDQDGAHDKVARLVAPVKQGRVEVGWRVVHVDDADDAPGEGDEAAGAALPEFIFRARRGEHEARCDDLLRVGGDLDLVVRDPSGAPVRDADYELVSNGRARRGRTDGEGRLRAAAVAPDLRVRLLDGRTVRLVRAAR